MSTVRPLRRPHRASNKTDWRQAALTSAIVAFPVLLCLAIAHSSGTPIFSFIALLPRIRLPQTLPSLDSILHSPSPWREISKALPTWEGEANPSPLLSSAAEVVHGHVCSVLPAELAVLGADGPFSRTIDGSLRDTKLAPHGTDLQSEPSGAQLDGCIFEVHDEAFDRLIGHQPSVQLIAQKKFNFAHEGPVWLPAVNRLFFVSNRLGNLETSDQRVELWTLDPTTLTTSQITPSVPILMANGATNWSPSEVLIISQGGNATGGALFALDVLTGKAERLLDNWQGLAFNSPNDIAVARDGSALWFTDPSCGQQQGFRSPEQLGEYVWRWDLRTRAASVAANGFIIPNGVAVGSGDKLYVTDTGCLHPAAPDGGSCTDANTPRTIWAFDIERQRDGSSLLGNRRLFAVTDTGVPDGIKVDTYGNVWTGMGDGVACYSPGGKLLGKVLVGEVSNLVFAGEVLVMLRETEVLAVKLATRGMPLPGMHAPVLSA